MDSGDALARSQPGDARTDLRPLLDADTGLVGRLMTDYACITAERWPGGLALLVVTACVPLQPLLAIVAPLLFLALRAPARAYAQGLLAPQMAPLAERDAETRIALASALQRIRATARRWP